MTAEMNRRVLAKFGLGSLVAALPVGARAVAAIPADLDSPPVDLMAGTDVPFWVGLSAHARHELVAHPELDGMGFWQWYEDALLDRVRDLYPGFYIDREFDRGFSAASEDKDDWWSFMVCSMKDGTRSFYFLGDLDDDDFDTLVGTLIAAKARNRGMPATR